MLSSLSQFLVNENTFKEMLRLQYIKGPINDATKDKYIKTFFEIAANLSLFCCNAISDHSTDRRINGIMFLETIQSNDNLNNSNKIIHYLNVIIDQLKSSVEFVYNQNYTADNLLCQKAVPQDINGDELVTHKYVKSFFNMNQCLCTTRDALSLCVFVTEQCLYLLWSHLDFYVRKTFSNDFEHKLLLDIHQQTTCSDDIGHLKKSLISTFNETFCKHILWTCESCAQVEKGFNEALLRRIKSLIQFA
ncbi:nuclear pore complex protein Nup205-like [Teleopsis dalmanni]|uniref:nuclear pore complex protein Nup205-like n=1 Tax=Teleopsis dalmanni TaxID=139649 RepID=UPI0018CF8249|nr:nuclear pore complex protein Nup205-like [Teleopsis dalmanni]